MNDPCVADNANNEKHKQTSGPLRVESLDFIAFEMSLQSRSIMGEVLERIRSINIVIMTWWVETLDVKRMN